MTTSIFNSLGSNYSASFVLKSVFGLGFSNSKKTFQKDLESHYGGKVTLTYKGREALELALKISNLPENSKIAINGFTCYVVYRAIKNAGYQPVFVDIAPKQMDFGINELKSHKDIKAVIIQNTLGYAVDIEAFKSYCTKQNIMIIEDCAHSLGAYYDNDIKVGKVGDLAMFSFSQDKPLDVVAGGALVDRRAKATRKLPELESVSYWRKAVNSDYPFWTAIIRSTYSIGLGRMLHLLLKTSHLLAGPMKDAGAGIHEMSYKTAWLARSKWQDRESELEHRKTIAGIYETELPKNLQLIKTPSGKPSYLRFPIIVSDRESLIKYLKKHRIYIGDTWYDAPIAPKRYLSLTDYKPGMCPNAENLAQHIVNLPTHIHITNKKAQYIAGKVKQWQALQ